MDDMTLLWVGFLTLSVLNSLDIVNAYQGCKYTDYKQDSGWFPDDRKIHQRDFRSLEACKRWCDQYSNCRAAVVSPSHWDNRECFLLSTSIVTTRSGWSVATKLTECTAQCSAGDYMTDSGCQQCGENTYSGDGASSCTSCSEGKVSGAGSTSENDCKSAGLGTCSGVAERSTVYGYYNWPDTLYGVYAKRPCVHNEKLKALKLCSEAGNFEDTDFTLCSSAVASKIDDILQDVENVDFKNETQIKTLSDQIENISADAGNAMSSDDVETTAEIIKAIVGSSDVKISDETLGNLISTIDNVQTFTGSEEVRKEETSNIFRESAVAISGVLAQNPDTFIAKTSVGFAAAKINNSSKPEKTNLLVLAGNTNVINGSTNDIGDESRRFFSAELTTTATKVATAVYYSTDKAFPSKAISLSENSDKSIAQQIAAGNEVSTVVTAITDINIVDTVSSQISSLEPNQKVVMTYKAPKETELKIYRNTKRKTLVNSKLTCKFYKESSNGSDWSDEGCVTTTVHDKDKRVTDVTCICDHLSGFAVLMSFTSESSYLEEEISHILLGISLFCLVLTLAAVLPIKKNMEMKSTKINLMLVVALIFSITCFFLMDSFVSAEEEDKPSIACSAIAFLLNYFWLCQLSWMVIEAVTMYVALVKVFDSRIRHLSMLKYSLAGWVLPLVFPIIALAWGGVQFADPKTCFVKKPFGFVTFYGPIVLGVTANWILFLLIIRAVIKGVRKSAEQTDMSNIKMRTKQLRSALLVSTFLGLGWIVGAFLLINDSNYSQISLIVRWLFIIVNAPQGLYIFIFYVLLKEDVRIFWIKIFGDWSDRVQNSKWMDQLRKMMTLDSRIETPTDDNQELTSMLPPRHGTMESTLDPTTTS